MKTLLVFSFFPAFVPPSNGGESRLLNFYRALSRHYKVVLLSSTGPGMPREEVWHTNTFVEKRIPRDHVFLQAWQQLEPLGSGGDLSAPALLQAGKQFNDLHQAYLDEYPAAQAVLHESPFTLGFDLFFGCDNKPRIYNAYNCETSLYQTLHPAKKSEPLVQEIRQAEIDLLAGAHALFYCATEDLSQMASLTDLGHLRTLYTPHGVSLPASAPHLPGLPEVKQHQVYFVGSAHPPNLQAAEFIARQLAPQLPQVTFHLIGSCGKLLKSQGNLKVHGFLAEPEKQAVISACTLAINPLSTGGGASLKVLDFIVAGKPLLSTQHGMRGYGFQSPTHFLHAELEHFPAALAHALSQPANVLLGMAARAMAYVHSQFGWHAITDQAAQFISQLIEQTGQHASQFALVLNDYNSFDAVGGGATRTQGLCTALAKQVPVVFLTYSSQRRTSNTLAGNIRVLQIPRSRRFEQELDKSRGLSHISVDDILTSLCLPTDALMNSVYAVLRRHTSVVVSEHCYMAQLPLLHGDRFVYSSQNNETALKAALLADHPEGQTLCAHVQQIEQRCLAAAALTVAVSDDDATAFSNAVNISPVVVVPNGVVGPALPVPAPGTEISGAFHKPVNVVFLGSAHMPNVFAAQFLVEEVVRKCPQLQFHFVGSACISVVKAPANLTLWGVVSSTVKSQILEQCQLALNPVLDGSGSNVKFADYLAHGLPTLSTEFGLRGYPAQAREVAVLAPKAQFATTLLQIAGQPDLWAQTARDQRKRVFHEFLDLAPIGQRFARLALSLNKPRKNVLFVTYRYTSPARGGAEVFAHHLVQALNQTGLYNIDVVATNALQITDPARFTSAFKTGESAAFHGLEYTRAVRFPCLDQAPMELITQARPAWRAQVDFEKSLWALQPASNPETTASAASQLLWGWSSVEGKGSNAQRWAFKNAGLQVAQAGALEIRAQVFKPALLRLALPCGQVLFEQTVHGDFSIKVQVPAASVIEMDTTAPLIDEDARPLAMLVKSVAVAGVQVELSAPRPIDIAVLKQQLPEHDLINLLATASAQSRTVHEVQLAHVRGPHSPALENYLNQNAGHYDLVITHNVVFKTASLAIAAAHRHGVPSLLVPHAHLDDDYYHFPDLLQTARQSSLVLASPKAAVEYYQQRQCTAAYLPAGIDASEFTAPANSTGFHTLYNSSTPFVLVLGRKSGAKNYQATIRAVDEINQQGHALNVVLIGPDDDQLPIQSPHAVYLGPQPREVVLAALHNCMALCNMSQSESFGIVLLEAWMARKPVIANSQCGAFAELAQNQVNALLVTEHTLSSQLLALLQNPELRESLGQAGYIAAQAYTWQSMQQQFLVYVSSLLGEK